MKAIQRIGSLTIISVALACAAQVGAQQAERKAATSVPDAHLYDSWFQGRTLAPTMARADLKACQELGRARLLAPGPASPEAFAAELTGTWVRELTWYGNAVETESALYFVAGEGGSFSAMEYDQVNLGVGPMTERLRARRAALRAANPDPGARLPSMTFVDCDNYVVDRYYKISQDLVFDGIPVDGALAAKSQGLLPIWQHLLDVGFFKREVRVYERGELANLTAAEISGQSIVGAFWEGHLSARDVLGLPAIALRMNGEYTGSHFAPGVVVKGFEDGNIVMEGDKFVSPADLFSTVEGAGLTKLIPDFVKLTWERFALDPADGAEDPRR